SLFAPPAHRLGLPARLVTGFVDVEMDALLGLDPQREAALVIVPVGASGRPAPSPPLVTALAPEVIPLSSREVDYPLLRQALSDSRLDSEAEVEDWRARGRDQTTPRHETGAEGLIALPAPSGEAGRSLAETIARRGSTREFSGEAIGAEGLSSALYHARRGFPGDAGGGGG